MSDSLFTWHVYLDHYPLRAPELIGEVEAPNIVAARAKAAAEWPRRKILVQSAASAKVRCVSKHPLPDAVPAMVETRGHPKKRGPAKQRQLDFNAAKRAAHAPARSRGEAMTPPDAPRRG